MSSFSTSSTLTGIVLFTSVIGFQHLSRRLSKLILNKVFSKQVTGGYSCSVSKSDFIKLDTSDKIQNYWISKDPENSFLEEVLSEEALTWVKEQNKYCLNKVGNPESSPFYPRVLSILESKDKIPQVSKVGSKFYYNFWQDSNNIKGLLRRTTFESYKSPNPSWETVLDIDLLGKEEKENWVYKGI